MENHICRICLTIANIQSMVDIEDDYGEKDLKWLHVFEMCIGHLPFRFKEIPCKLCSKCSLQLRNFMGLKHKAQQSYETQKKFFTAPKPLPQTPQSDNLKGQLSEEEPKEDETNENLKDSSDGSKIDELPVEPETEAASSTDDTVAIRSDIVGDIAVEYPQEIDFLVFGEDNVPAAVAPPTELKKSKHSQKRQESIRCNLCGKRLQRGSLRRHMFRFHKTKIAGISK